MQCIEQEDRTDPLYMLTGGSSCPQLSREENTISGTAWRREMNPKVLQTRNRPPTVRSINIEHGSAIMLYKMASRNVGDISQVTHEEESYSKPQFKKT